MVATDGIDVDVETLGTKELAYHITLLDWDLFWAIHEYELLYHTFGRHHFGKVRGGVDGALFLFKLVLNENICLVLFCLLFRSPPIWTCLYGVLTKFNIGLLPKLSPRQVSGSASPCCGNSSN